MAEAPEAHWAPFWPPGPKHTPEAPEAPQIHFTHPLPQGCWLLGQKTQEPSPLEDHLCAKFHPNLSSCLDFNTEQRQTYTALYLVD